jgi:REP element-mobilizing transposase RayT
MNQKPPRRKPSRLGGYDYSQPGGYFVTLVTHQRTCVFGDIIDGEMRLNTVGKIVQEEWIRSAQIRSEVMLDEFIIMPNHFHAILFILDKNNRKHNFLEFQPQVRATGRSPQPGSERPRGPAPRSLGAFIAGFKSSVTKRVNRMNNTPGSPLWQRNYFDRVIRDEDELDHIRKYIWNNPHQWEEDEENPSSLY